MAGVDLVHSGGDEGEQALGCGELSYFLLNFLRFRISFFFFDLKAKEMIKGIKEKEDWEESFRFLSDFKLKWDLWEI